MSDPADYCPLGHGPMWYAPFSDQWACQNVHCGQTTPVPAHLVLDLPRARDQIMPEHTIDASRYMTAHWATSYPYGAMVKPPTARLFVTNAY